jgi:hypothetical protein
MLPGNSGVQHEQDALEHQPVFQDGGARAMGLSDVAIGDIDYLDLDF